MEKMFRMKGFRMFVALIDLWIMGLALFTVVHLIGAAGFTSELKNQLMVIMPWGLIVHMSCLYLFNLYDLCGRKVWTHWVTQLCFGCGFSAIANVVLIHLLFAGDVHTWLWVSVVGVGIVGTMAWRIMLQFWQRRTIGKKKLLIIVEESSIHHEKLTMLIANGEQWFTIQQICIVSADSQHIPDALWKDIDVVMIGADLTAELKMSILIQADLERTEVLMIPHFYELSFTQPDKQQLEDVMFYSILPSALQPWERFFKRGLDLAIALMMLIVASPVMLALYWIIPRHSPGKALFVQERVGRDGKKFLLYKFRSMVDCAEQATGPVLAQEKDHRITRLGELLRATRLDELPQLVNILLGHMSLVGPRPERQFFIEQFEQDMPDYRNRLLVKPGLTGLAQVKGNYTTSPRDKLSFDLTYIRNYSLLLDLNILFQTIIVVFRRDQAKGMIVGQETIPFAKWQHLVHSKEIASAKEQETVIKIRQSYERKVF